MLENGPQDFVESKFLLFMSVAPIAPPLFRRSGGF